MQRTKYLQQSHKSLPSVVSVGNVDTLVCSEVFVSNAAVPIFKTHI